MTSAATLYSPLCVMFFSQATVNCQSIQIMPDVTFTLNGQAFTVPASAYVSQVS